MSEVGAHYSNILLPCFLVQHALDEAGVAADLPEAEQQGQEVVHLHTRVHHLRETPEQVLKVVYIWAKNLFPVGKKSDHTGWTSSIN